MSVNCVSLVSPFPACGPFRTWQLLVPNNPVFSQTSPAPQPPPSGFLCLPAPPIMKPPSVFMILCGLTVCHSRPLLLRCSFYLYTQPMPHFQNTDLIILVMDISKMRSYISLPYLLIIRKPMFFIDGICSF